MNTGISDESEEDIPVRTLVPRLVALLRFSDARVRRGAIEELFQLGPPPDAAVPDIIAGMSDEDGGVRHAAAHAIRSLDALPETAVPLMIEALADPVAEVRQAAAEALGRFKVAMRSAMPELVRLLHEGDQHDRTAALGTVLEYMELDRGLLKFRIRERPEGPDFEAVAAAARALCDPEKEVSTVVSRLLAHLVCSERDEVSRMAAYHLKRMGAEVEMAVPILVAALGDPREQVREAATKILSAIKPEVLIDSEASGASPAFQEPGDLLASPHPVIRENALRRIRSLGREAIPLVPKLIPMLSDPDPGVRTATVDCLSQIDLVRHTASEVGRIQDLLSDPDPRVREAAATALPWFGSEAVESAEAELVGLLGDQDAGVRATAAHAFVMLDEPSEEAAARLVDTLDDPDPRVGLEAADALVRSDWSEEPRHGERLVALVGDRAPHVVDRLRDLLKTRDRHDVFVAAAGLGRLGRHAVPGVPDLVEALTYHGSGEPGGDVARALERLGEHAAPAIPGLLKLAREPGRLVDDFEERVALRALALRILRRVVIG